MYCPNCGREVANDTVFCDRCGTALSEKAAAVRNMPVYDTVSAAAPAKKKGMDASAQFLLAAVIGVTCLSIVSTVSNQMVASYGTDAVVGYMLAFRIPRAFLYVVLAVEALILLIVLSNGKTTNAALIVGLAMEGVFCILTLVMPASLIQIFAPYSGSSEYVIRFLRFFGVACIICTAAFAVIGFNIKKRSIAPDLIMFGIAAGLAFLLLFIEFFMVRGGLDLQLPLHAVSIGMIHAATVLVPCAGRGANR